MTTDQNHHGGVAVITGASSGIGEATARALAAEGYRLALLARRADRIEALAAELSDTAVAITADVTDRDSLVAAANRVRSELGGADVLVNNAGVMLLAPFSSDQRAEIRQMVEVNLLGAMTATEVFLDQLRDGGGDLVNISSVAGRTARAGNADRSPPYAHNRDAGSTEADVAIGQDVDEWLAWRALVKRPGVGSAVVDAAHRWVRKSANRG